MKELFLNSKEAVIKKRIFDSFINNEQNENLEKAHIKQHERTTKSGKIVQVKEHEDKRQKDDSKIDNLKFLTKEMKNIGYEKGILVKEEKDGDYIQPFTKEISKNKYHRVLVYKKGNIFEIQHYFDNKNKSIYMGSVRVKNLNDLKPKIKFKEVFSYLEEYSKNSKKELSKKHFMFYNG